MAKVTIESVFKFLEEHFEFLIEDSVGSNSGRVARRRATPPDKLPIVSRFSCASNTIGQLINGEWWDKLHRETGLDQHTYRHNWESPDPQALKVLFVVHRVTKALALPLPAGESTIAAVWQDLQKILPANPILAQKQILDKLRINRSWQERREVLSLSYPNRPNAQAVVNGLSAYLSANWGW